METSKGFATARDLLGKPGYAAEISWSPDSEWLSFISKETKIGRRPAEQLFKVNVTTKEIVQITAFPEGTLIGDSTTWSTHGLIAFERDREVFGVPSEGGQEHLLLDTRAALSNERPSYLRFSPDGGKLIFSAENQEQDKSNIWLADLKSGSIQRLTHDHFDLFPNWLDSRHILFSREQSANRSEVYVLSLLTHKLERITSGHIDFTPSAGAPSGRLYFSRKGRVPKEFQNAGLLVGFHIWYTSLGRAAGGRAANP